MKYLKIIIKTIHAKLYLWFTYLIPKNKNLWVFGSWKGRNYSDNSRVLFEYICNEHKEIHAVWIAKNERVYNEVKQMGNEVVLYPSREAKKIVAHAGVNIQTEGNEDTGRFRVGGTKIIQLFHGYGSVKEARLFANMSYLKKKIVKIYADDHSKSSWMVPSDYFVNRLPIIYETDKNKMFITGQPRIDLLLRKKKIGYFEDFIIQHGDSKLLLYVPTHRKYGLTEDKCMTLDEWSKFNEYLRSKEFYLFFKPHPLEMYKYEKFEYFSNIIIITKVPNAEDVYEYLHYFDAIISDYSSIATDFLVLDRPIIHYMYDLDSFSSEDMYIDSNNKFICGPICKTQVELFNAIDDAFENDTYQEQRKKVRELSFKYVDANNCKRVYDEIIGIICKKGI